ncbi:FtsX-like permease family protein [Desulfurispirillum indicum]|uniref:ABC transporter permease n=1 Tax=Desulfurispirillum indicum TaxID=936456 RepID=UPI001CFAA86F|nr:FtsX-like permease family protein [Desulfurispirillum indicum]UCZ57368.1 FtsX-like permease family protein [Desulfurispirillum indicum]
MSALHRKLLRDLLTMKGQVAAIAVVIAAGVMVLILSVMTLDAITLSRDRFYQEQHFAHIFSEVKRAPEGVAERLRLIPGVSQVQTRVLAPVRLEVDGFSDPVRGLILALPDGHQPDLNRVYLREGSLPQPGYADQVLITETFSQAHQLHTGDQIRAIINGRLETLTISGVGLSPEFIYLLGPNDLMPDYYRYGVLWMNRRALANALDMDGAFNSVLLSLQSGADMDTVIDAVDLILAPYGSIGAYGRHDQISHRFLHEELNQLRGMAMVLPAIFLGVAAFLLHVLMGRIVHTQRQQIAVLKAFGYRNREIALHYILLTSLIAVLGSLLGIALGIWAGQGMAGIYAEYYRFPVMSFRLQPSTLALGLAVACGAAILGASRAVQSAVSQAPAEAMRPPAPERFQRGWLEQLALGRFLGQTSRIIVRTLSRHRVKAFLTVTGISFSGALLLMGSYQFGSVSFLLDLQYRKVLHMDLNLGFSEQMPQRAAAELRALPGVSFVETYRNVPVRLIHGRKDYRTAIQGMEAQPQMHRLLDARYQPITLPPEGLLLSSYIAGYLDVREGDMVELEIMEGHRRTISVALAGTVDDLIGVGAYMERRALNRLLREGPVISGAWLMTDRSLEEELFPRLWQIPAVASIGQISNAERVIRTYMEDTMLVFMGILLVMAGSIAFAVVYNNARIAFAERYRELATLRVLGFTRSEVAWVLIGEAALLTFLAIPLGWLIGTGFALMVNEAFSSELFRLPLVVSHQVYAFAALGVLLASSLSILLILRRLKDLDMAAALKTE